MQDMDIAVQLGQWIPFSAWTPNEEVLFLPQLENQLLLRLHHCGAVRARVECSGLPLEVDNNNWESSLKLIYLQLHKKLPKNSMSTILWSFGIWSKLERRKSSVRGCLTSWLQLKKIIILRCHLVFYATVINCFSIRFWCATKSGLCTTTGNSQLSGWTEKKLRSTSQRSSEALLKAKFAPEKKKKDMVTVRWSAAALIHCSFLSPSETITSEKYAQQIAEMHRKLQCLQLALVNRKGPVLLHDNARLHVAQPMFQKLNELG